MDLLSIPNGVPPLLCEDGFYRAFLMDSAALTFTAADLEVRHLQLWCPGLHDHLVQDRLMIHTASKPTRSPIRFPVHVVMGRDAESVTRFIEVWKPKIEAVLPFFLERRDGNPLHALIDVKERHDAFAMKASIQRFAPLAKRVRHEPVQTLIERYAQLSDMIGEPYITMKDQDGAYWLHVQHAEHLVAARLIELI